MNRDEIIERTRVMIVAANPNFTEEQVMAIAVETADQYEREEPE